MKIKKIGLFLFFISFSSLLSSEITFLSTKTLQAEKAIQIVITINSTEEIDKSDISIYEYQTSSSSSNHTSSTSISTTTSSSSRIPKQKNQQSSKVLSSSWHPKSGFHPPPRKQGGEGRF